MKIITFNGGAFADKVSISFRINFIEKNCKITENDLSYLFDKIKDIFYKEKKININKINLDAFKKEYYDNVIFDTLTSNEYSILYKIEIEIAYNNKRTSTSGTFYYFTPDVVKNYNDVIDEVKKHIGEDVNIQSLRKYLIHDCKGYHFI